MVLVGTFNDWAFMNLRNDGTGLICSLASLISSYITSISIIIEIVKVSGHLSNKMNYIVNHEITVI